VKNRFQNLPFKFKLQRYTAGACTTEDCYHSMAMSRGGAVHVCVLFYYKHVDCRRDPELASA
jgi:hypothetical protein